jgi:YebC/PmpR family DNA-binding regulatory protein
MVDVAELESHRGELSERERRFAKLHREISVAAREQGSDPEENLSLRLAMRRARDANMPEDTIEPARRRGSGEEDGSNYKQVTFEGYGPMGVAVFVEALTDDPSRTREELEDIFQAHDGSIGEEGCVAWQFDKRGLVQIAADSVGDEDTFMMQALEVGAEDVKSPLYDASDEGRVPVYRVHCDYEDTLEIADALDESGYRVHDASPVREATQNVELDREEAREFMKFYEKVSSHIDVRNLYANWSSK